MIAEAVENIDRARGTWECAVRNVKFRKEWRTLGIECFVAGEYKPPAELFDARMPTWSQKATWFPPSLSEAQKADVAAALAEAREAMKPAGPEAVLALLLRLTAVVVMPDRTATETMLEIYTEDLEAVPADLLDAACRGWRRTQKFFPTVSELLQLAGPELAQRRRRLVCLETLQAIANEPAPDETLALPWCERVAAHGFAQVPAPLSLTGIDFAAIGRMSDQKTH